MTNTSSHTYIQNEGAQLRSRASLQREKGGSCRCLESMASTSIHLALHHIMNIFITSTGDYRSYCVCECIETLNKKVILAGRSSS